MKAKRKRDNEKQRARVKGRGGGQGGVEIVLQRGEKKRQSQRANVGRVGRGKKEKKIEKRGQRKMIKKSGGEKG